MEFTGPVSFAEAVKHLAAQGLMPTGLDSAGIRALDAELRRQSLFSAKTLSEGLLGRYREVIGSIVDPQQVVRSEEGGALSVTEGYDPAWRPSGGRRRIARGRRLQLPRPACSPPV